jgi:hypothetical protein
MGEWPLQWMDLSGVKGMPSEALNHHSAKRVCAVTGICAAGVHVWILNGQRVGSGNGGVWSGSGKKMITNDPTVYHYNDSYGHEIDAIVQKRNGDHAAFEIKLGVGFIDDAAEDLKNSHPILTETKWDPQNH